jgi:purine-binding chemotaxis protein CheW
MEENNNNLDKMLSLRRERSSEIVNVDEASVKLVIFELAGDWFAFQGENISEILPGVDVFFVPGCPASLEGVINVRGDIDSVIRLSELLGKPLTDTTAASSILRGHSKSMRSGIRVDRVIDVLDVVQSAIQPPHASLPEHMRHIVTGFMKHQDKPVALLDLERIFEDYRNGLG